MKQNFYSSGIWGRRKCCKHRHRIFQFQFIFSQNGFSQCFQILHGFLRQNKIRFHKQQTILNSCFKLCQLPQNLSMTSLASHSVLEKRLIDFSCPFSHPCLVLEELSLLRVVCTPHTAEPSSPFLNLITPSSCLFFFSLPLLATQISSYT